MTDTLTIVGRVGNEPKATTTSLGSSMTTFRVATKERRFDRNTSSWVDGETNWYGVACFNSLAENVAHSIHSGDSVVISGKLKVRPWSNGERSGTNVDVEAEAVGHNLAWGESSFVRGSASTHAAADGSGSGTAAADSYPTLSAGSVESDATADADAPF